jgi:hypothetical protein
MFSVPQKATRLVSILQDTRCPPRRRRPRHAQKPFCPGTGRSPSPSPPRGRDVVGKAGGCTIRIDAVNLERRLRNIDADCANFTHGRLPSMWFVSTQPPYGTSMPQSGRRPPHQSLWMLSVSPASSCSLRPESGPITTAGSAMIPIPMSWCCDANHTRRSPGDAMFRR